MEFSLATAEGRANRVALLSGADFLPLEEFRRAIAIRHGPTPHMDPLDGGTAARILLLLEAPGPTGANPRFISRDNPTGTARNLTRFLETAGIGRRQVLLWNAVPWIIHAEGARNRAPRADEITAGLSWLPGLLDRLPSLRGVVMAGRVAQRANHLLEEIRPALKRVTMPHPSPIYVNTSPSIAMRITTALTEVRTACIEAHVRAE